MNIIEISGVTTLPEHKCQIRLRAGGAFLDRQPSVEEVMTLDSKIDQGKHEEEVGKLSNKVAVLMKSFESLSYLAMAYRRGDYKRMAVTVSAQEYLSSQLS